MNLKKIKRSHTRQQDRADCGVACLSSAIKYFGGAVPLYRLRENSGTDRRGTTLLGLQQAAAEVGLTAQGMKSDLCALKSCPDLCILHVVSEEKFYHYVLCYGYDARKSRFYIGDPASPQIRSYTDEELLEIWQSGVLLRLQAGPGLLGRELHRQQRFQWIKSLVREDLNLLLMGLLLGFVIALLGIANAVFSQKLIDDLLPRGDLFLLFAGIGALFLLLLFQSLLTYGRTMLLLTQSKRFNIRIINFFYRKLLRLPKTFFDHRKAGDLVARMNDTRRIQSAISNLLGNIMIDLILIMVASVAIFTYHQSIGLLSLLWIPVFAVIALYFHPRILQAQRKVMVGYAQTESTFMDTIEGIDAIKTNNREPVFAAMTVGTYGHFQEATLALGKIGLHYNVLTQIAGTVFVIAIVGLGAYDVHRDQLSVGSFVAILQMTAVLMGAVTKVALANIQLQEAKVTFERMFEYTAMEPESPSGEGVAMIRSFERLCADQLGFGFPGRRPLLRDLSFQVERGEWISILGESGCGKSTLLQILQKFYTVTEGQVRVNDVPLDDLGHAQWRSLIGVVPQRVKIFNGTLLDNITLGNNTTDPKQVEQLLEDFGFDRYFRDLPGAYHTIIGEDGVNISGGQRQLMALARSLLKRPQLLLLDEPTAALDRNTENFVLDLLGRLRSQMAIIVFTHKIKTARLSDRIYIIGPDGSMQQSGMHAELLQSPNLYSHSWADLVGAV